MNSATKGCGAWGLGVKGKDLGLGFGAQEFGSLEC